MINKIMIMTTFRIKHAKRHLSNTMLDMMIVMMGNGPWIARDHCQASLRLPTVERLSRNPCRHDHDLREERRGELWISVYVYVYFKR